jgi:outer membrane protein
LFKDELSRHRDPGIIEFPLPGPVVTFLDHFAIAKEESMKKVIVLLCVSLFLASGFAYAQDQIKIGYVNMRKALNESKSGKAAKETLEKSIKEKQGTLDEEKKKLESLQEDFEKKTSLLSDKAKQDKQKEFQEKVQAYQKLVADAQKEINEKEAAVTKKIIDDIKKIIADMGKEENYTLIFEETEISVLYAQKGLDLTDKVLEKLNAASK